MKIRVAGIVNDSVVDGPGIRLAVFTQGCPHNCPGCHNPHTHALSGGQEMDTADITAMVLKNPLLDGVTFSGGEPFLQPDPLLEIARDVKNQGLNVIVFTGYYWEELMENDKFLPFLHFVDYVVDGRFEEDKKSLDLRYKGSTNQRVIDVKNSMAANKICEIDF